MGNGEPSTGQYTARAANGGRRSDDANRIISILFSAVVFFVVGWGGWVFATARASETKNIEQDGRINTLEKSIQKMDDKLDRILERIK